MKTILKEAEFSLTNIHGTIQLIYSCWLIKQSVVILDQNKLTKENIDPLIYYEELPNIKEKHHNYSHNYTDGSEDKQNWVWNSIQEQNFE